MFVKDVGSGGRGRKEKGAGSTLAKSIGKAAGPLGAVVALGMMGSELSDVSNAEKAGEITKEKAKEEKGGIVGEGIGGAGGALAGGKAGAMLGSLAGPVGTLVGGVIGAVGGGLMGALGGKTAGKAIAATPASAEKSSKDAVKPSTETATAAAKSPINFNTTDPIALLKAAQESTPKATSMQPAASAEAARKTLENKVAEEKENAAEMERLNNKAKAAAGPAAGATPTAQESTDSAIAMLNTHMAELVRISKENNRIGEKQLSVQEGYGGDLFSNVMA